MRDKTKDVAMMQHPENWPQWPVLPLINRENRQTGILVEGTPRVYVGVNIWDLKVIPPDTQNTIGYESFEKLADEWRVD